ncbi:putative RxLR effector, partial [Phytophthora palmivora]
MPLPPAPASHTRVLCGGLTWPAVRGARLLRSLTSSHSQEEEEEDPFCADFPYELELCVPTAGHV